MNTINNQYSESYNDLVNKIRHLFNEEQTDDVRTVEKKNGIKKRIQRYLEIGNPDKTKLLQNCDLLQLQIKECLDRVNHKNLEEKLQTALEMSEGFYQKLS